MSVYLFAKVNKWHFLTFMIFQIWSKVTKFDLNKIHKKTSKVNFCHHCQKLSTNVNELLTTNDPN